MKKIIIIAAAVVVLGGAAALYFFVFRSAAEKPEDRIEYPLEFFVTNVANSNRMLKTTIVLVVNDKKLPEALAEQNTIIRDTILFILRDLSVDEISATGRQDELRKKIITAVNNKLGIDNIVEVRFNDFVMQ